VWGDYVTALGETWHRDHFLCAGCGKPLSGGKFQVAQGKAYHPACYLAFQAPRCTCCGQPIAGQYTESEGKAYHPECFREHVVPRCIYCQRPLLGKYMVDAWGDKYCPEHETQYPRCSCCSRLVPPRQQTRGWEDYGIVRCAVCRATAIEVVEQAQPLFQQCKQWISRQGFTFNKLPLRLELRERGILLNMLGDRAINHPLGVTLSSTMQYGQQRSSRIDGVAVLQGMPATLFAGVVLHELGHVWLTVHGIEHLPPWAEEGFCELLSYRYYSDLNTPEALVRASSLEKGSDPIYGDGFRAVRVLSDRLGFAHLVEVLLTTKRLPAA
jgi:hypothetical protein